MLGWRWIVRHEWDRERNNHDVDIDTMKAILS